MRTPTRCGAPQAGQHGRAPPPEAQGRAGREGAWPPGRGYKRRHSVTSRLRSAESAARDGWLKRGPPNPLQTDTQTAVHLRRPGLGCFLIYLFFFFLLILTPFSLPVLFFCFCLLPSPLLSSLLLLPPPSSRLLLLNLLLTAFSGKILPGGRPGGD